MRSGAAGVLVAGVALVVAAVVLVAGWATEKRETIVVVPQPSPLLETEVIKTRPDQEVCLRGATFVPRARVALVRVGTRRKPGVPLSATVSGPGYRSEASIDGNWKDNDLLAFGFDAPPGTFHGEFCLRNEGERPVDIYAATDAIAHVRTYRDGRPVGANMQLAFRTAEPMSVADRAGEIVDRMTVFRPGIVGNALVWVLAVLTLLALTVGVGLAMWRSAREADGDEPDAGAPARPDA